MYTCIVLNTPLLFPNFTSSRDNDDDLMCRVVFVIQTSEGVPTQGSLGNGSPSVGSTGEGPGMESEGQSLTFVKGDSMASAPSASL